MWLYGGRHAQAVLLDKLLQLEDRGGSAPSKLVGEHEEEVVVIPGNGSFTVEALAFWDVQPNDSDLYVEVTVTPADSVLGGKIKSGLVVDPYTCEIVRYGNFPQ